MQVSFIFQLIILATLIVLVIGLAAVMMFQLAMKQKKKHLIEQHDAALKYLKEINQTKIDIKDDTLKQVAMELHDNIGQLIALSRIHIKILQKKYIDDTHVENINQITENALHEIRRLSSTLNAERIKEFGLIESLHQQKVYVKQSSNMDMQIHVSEHIRAINKEHELILYRICQEFISNTLKYAEASCISISLQFNEKNLVIELRDNGKGFDLNLTHKGNGIIHMQTRAELLHANVLLHSSPNEGTTLKINYPYDEV